MKLRYAIPAFLALAALGVVEKNGTEAARMSDMTIVSPAFQNNGTIPAKHTCDGADVSPPLSIANVPANAKSLALIMDDPDAPVGTWVHWVVWNIDPKTVRIDEGSAPRGAAQGLNDFRTRKYGGPCPPSGTHRYFFKLYALDAALSLGPDTTKAALEAAMKGHVLAEAGLVGLYSRKGRR